MQILQRYILGDCEGVWAELFRGVDKNGELIAPSEAEAIALETMARTKNNLEILADRLFALGYKWSVSTDAATPISLPSSDIKSKIAQLVRLVGPLPLSLRLFWEIVGSVDFQGTWPEATEFEGLEEWYPIRVPSCDRVLTECESKLSARWQNKVTRKAYSQQYEDYGSLYRGAYKSYVEKYHQAYKASDKKVRKPYKIFSDLYRSGSFFSDFALWFDQGGSIDIMLPDDGYDILVINPDVVFEGFTFADYLRWSCRSGGSWYWELMKENYEMRVPSILLHLSQDLVPV